MNDDDDRLTLRQRRAIDARLANRRDPPPGDWFWLFVALLVMGAILAFGFALAGCIEATDAALIRELNTKVDTVIKGVDFSSTESNKAAVRAKRIERSVNIGSQNFDTWAIYLLIIMPFITYIIPKFGWHVASAAKQKLLKPKVKGP